MRPRLVFALVLGLALSSCTAATPTPRRTSATPTTDPTTTPTKKPPKLKKARFAVYVDGDEIILYDAVKDEITPVARGAGLAQPKFVTRSLISFVQHSQSSRRSIFSMVNLADRSQERLFEEEDGIDVYDLSPNQQRIAYVTRDELGYPRVRVRTLVGTRAVKSAGTLARAIGREGIPDDQISIEYDKRGRRFMLSYTWADGTGDVGPEQSQFQIRDDGGTLLFAAEHAKDPTMGVWSWNQKRVYFRTDDGPRAWRVGDGVVEGVAGLTDRWFNPSVSPDGKAIAYDTGSGSPNATIRVVTLSSGGVATVSQRGRFNPVFASANLVWAQKLGPCTGDACLSATTPRAQVVKINLQNGKESLLSIRDLQGADIWYA